jgi:acetylxylan esterase
MLVRSVLGFLAASQLAWSATLEKVANFGANPSKINMYIYVPDKVATKPAIIVAVRNIATIFALAQDY